MRKRSLWLSYPLLTVILFLAATLGISSGSVRYPFTYVWEVVWRAATGQELVKDVYNPSVITAVRLPHVLCAGLEGAALALCGAAMQGLLRNPLADGATLGVSSGATLGAAAGILLGFGVGLPLSGPMVLAMLTAFLSLVLVLGLAWALDHAMSTHTIILIGVVFSMFVGSLMNILILYSGNKLRSITFWTMGTMSTASMKNAGVLAVALLLLAPLLLTQSRALNALAMGEDQAQHIGVPVRRVKLIVMAAASALIGICVSVCGCIGFVGLVVPHMVRMLAGPDHRDLLPMSMLGGATFLILCELAARMMSNSLPIGVVTSLIGAVLFIFIFCRARKAGEQP